MLDQTSRLDRMFHALADHSRRRMVERLCEGPTTVSELAKPLSMSLAAVVQHVQVLEACGLVRTRKVGRSRTCALDREVLGEAERWIAQRRAAVARRLDRLGELVRDPTRQEQP